MKPIYKGFGNTWPIQALAISKRMEIDGENRWWKLMVKTDGENRWWEQMVKTASIEANKSKCFSVQLGISLNFEIKNKILKKILVNFLTISGSFKDFSFFLTKKWGGVPIFFWLES